MVYAYKKIMNHLYSYAHQTNLDWIYLCLDVAWTSVVEFSFEFSNPRAGGAVLFWHNHPIAIFDTPRRVVFVTRMRVCWDLESLWTMKFHLFHLFSNSTTKKMATQLSFFQNIYWKMISCLQHMDHFVSSHHHSFQW